MKSSISKKRPEKFEGFLPWEFLQYIGRKSFKFFGSFFGKLMISYIHSDLIWPLSAYCPNKYTVKSGLELFNLFGHSSSITALCFIVGSKSTGDTFLASGSEDGQLSFWDLNSRIRLKSFKVIFLKLVCYLIDFFRIYVLSTYSTVD